MSDSKGGRCGPVFTVRLDENMAEVIGDRFLAEPQILGNLAIVLALGHQFQDTGFTPGQSGWQGR